MDREGVHIISNKFHLKHIVECCSQVGLHSMENKEEFSIYSYLRNTGKVINDPKIVFISTSIFLCYFIFTVTVCISELPKKQVSVNGIFIFFFIFILSREGGTKFGYC
jgi:hypothetical protein